MSIGYDTHETPVIFRIWDNGAVTALFPTLPGAGDTLGAECLAYEQRGGEQSYDYATLMQRTYAAEPREYKALAAALRQRNGYNLLVVNYATDGMHRARRQAAVEARREQMRSVTTVQPVRR